MMQTRVALIERLDTHPAARWVQSLVIAWFADSATDGPTKGSKTSECSSGYHRKASYVDEILRNAVANSRDETGTRRK